MMGVFAGINVETLYQECQQMKVIMIHLKFSLINFRESTFDLLNL